MEIIFRGRQTDVPERFRDYATAKLDKLVKLDQKTIIVDVELSVERNPRQSSQKERVELTIWSRGPAIRAEAAAEDKIAALDLALAKLNSRLRRALDRRKNHYGPGADAVTGASAGLGGSTGPGDTGPGPGGRAGAPAASPVPMARSGEPGQAATAPKDDGAGAESLVSIQMDGDGPLVIRQKFHHAKPISIDQALLEMELVGHDFYLFHDVQENMPSVVYRRHGYQYGVIRLVENAADAGMEAEPSTAGLGGGIPGRRRTQRAAAQRGGSAAPLSEDGASQADKSPVLRPG